MTSPNSPQVCDHGTTLIISNLSKNDVSQSILKYVPILVLLQETVVVVIVDKVTKDGDVFEHGQVLRDSIVDVSHRLFLLEGVLQLVVHGVVEGGGNWALVAGHVVRIAVKDLTYGIDPGRAGVFCPEVFGYLRYGVDTNAVKPVILDSVPDPFCESGANERIGLVQVGEIRESAHFHL